MGKKTVLLVEGKDDEHVVKHLCGARELGKIQIIQEHGGFTQLRDAFPLRLKESNTESLGVIVDADKNVSARWESMRSVLLDHGGITSLPSLCLAD